MPRNNFKTMQNKIKALTLLLWRVKIFCVIKTGGCRWKSMECVDYQSTSRSEAAPCGQCVRLSRAAWSQNRLTFLVFVCARRLEKHFRGAPRAGAWGGGRGDDTASVRGLVAGAGVALATRPNGASQIGRKHDRTLLLPTRNRPFLLPIKHKVFRWEFQNNR